MRLLRVKVGGHFVLRNSGWFTIHPGCTSIAAPAGGGKSTLLRALRSVNPPFCDSDPAPFAEFPRFSETTGYRRKILPDKKTAVIAVFICDDPLREKLATIDPVYWQTDRIEVGRKLDNSRWITFVEIAASGRWSEVVEEMVRLGKLCGQGKVAEKIAAYLGAKASLQSTDRVKGELAEELMGLLDQLAGHFASEEQRQQLQGVQRIVNRAAHYQEAVNVVGQSLPVLVYLDRGCLLSGAIGDGAKAERTAPRQNSCRPCPDLILRELLGISQSGQDDEGRRTGRLHAPAPHLEENGRQLAARLSAYLPDMSLQFLVKQTAGRGEVQASSGGTPFSSLAALALPFRWMLSCAVCACYYHDSEKRQIIFLLDEPEAALSHEEKDELAAFLLRLSGLHQVLTTTAGSSAFPPASGRRYRLQEEESGGRVVADLPERNASRK